MKIKEMALENRPRERMFREGASVLSDAELLAVMKIRKSALPSTEVLGLTGSF